MDLLSVKKGQWVRVKMIRGGVGVSSKLQSLGILPGDTLRIVREAPFGGPVLVEVSGREIALGRGVAQKIEVEELSSP
mgnify:CR=1 FL=1